MKHFKHLMGITLFMIAVGSAYSCNLKSKENNDNIDRGDTALLTTTVSEKPSKQFVKVALLLDTSNSMDGLINQAKAQLWDIVNEFTYAKCGNETRPSLEIALYEYGNDNLASNEGYIRQVIGFSSD